MTIKKFRRGFAKSGDFTIAEEDILIRYGDTLSLLESGELRPETELEQQFLQVLALEKAPESKIEKAWMKYVHLARDRKKFHTLNSKKSIADSESDDGYSDASDVNDDIIDSDDDGGDD